MHSSFYLFALSYILLQYSKSCVICFCQCNKKLPGGVDTPLLVAITAPSLKCVKLLVDVSCLQYSFLLC